MERTDLGQGAFFALAPAFLPDHGRYLRALLEELPLRQEELTIFGRAQRTPRLTSFHGDPGCAYRYSGRFFAPRPWTPSLAELLRRVSEASGYSLNCALANYYRTGDDAMGAHADDEPELGPRPDDVAVVSLSLGARRRFLLTRRGGGERHTFDLGEGDLLVMGGTTQRHFVHRVPRTKKPVGPRLNLTFRHRLP